MAKKKKADEGEVAATTASSTGFEQRDRVASSSKLSPGGGSRRVKTRLIVIYGPPKARKTGSLRNLPMGRTKWLVSDSNCLATLRALGCLPADEDIHEKLTLEEVRSFTAEALQLAETEGADALGIDYLVYDSVTATADAHQERTAKATNQSYMGENKKDAGWQQFNQQFGQLLDDFAKLSQYVTVIILAHAPAKPPEGKGEAAAMALPGQQLAPRLARLANWILFKQTARRVVDDDAKAEDFACPEAITFEQEGSSRIAVEDVFYTKPPQVGFIASVNTMALNSVEPGDLMVLLQKDGLV